MGRAAWLVGGGCATVLLVGAGLVALVGGTAVGAGAALLAFAPTAEVREDSVMAAAVLHALEVADVPEDESRLVAAARRRVNAARTVVDQARDERAARIASEPGAPRPIVTSPGGSGAGRAASPSVRAKAAVVDYGESDEDFFGDEDDLLGIRDVAEPATAPASKGYKKASVEENDDFFNTLVSSVESGAKADSGSAAPEDDLSGERMADELDSLLDDFEMQRTVIEDDKKKRAR